MTVRIKPGPKRHWSSGRVELWLDRQLPQSDVDRIAAAIESVGTRADDTLAVELDDSGVLVEYFDTDSDGKPVLDGLLDFKTIRARAGS